MPNNENNNQWGSSVPDPNDSWGQAPEHFSQQSGEGNSQSSSAIHYESAQAASNQSSEPKKSRKLPILIASLAVVALVLLAAGGWYFTKRNNDPEESKPAQAPASQTSPNEHPNSPKQVKPKASDPTDKSSGTNTGSCDPHSPKSDMRNPVKGFCDGQWMLLGDYGTDSMALYYWTGKEWGTYVPDGQFTEGAMTDCYTTDKLRNAQAPTKLMNAMSSKDLLCNSSARMNDSSGSPSSSSDKGNNEQHHSQPTSKPPCHRPTSRWRLATYRGLLRRLRPHR